MEERRHPGITRPATLSDRSLALLFFTLLGFGILESYVDGLEFLNDPTRAFLIIEGVALFAMTAVIARVYWRNFRIAPEKARLLPRHVVQLGVLVLGLTLTAVALTIYLVDDAPEWFGIPVLLPSMTVGVLGLVDMIRWLPRRRPDLLPTGERRMT